MVGKKHFRVRGDRVKYFDTYLGGFKGVFKCCELLFVRLHNCGLRNFTFTPLNLSIPKILCLILGYYSLRGVFGEDEGFLRYCRPGPQWGALVATTLSPLARLCRGRAQGRAWVRQWIRLGTYGRATKFEFGGVDFFARGMLHRVAVWRRRNMRMIWRWSWRRPRRSCALVFCCY